ncbi:MAG: carboxypeptidase-like regulatory domain-containing protein [Flavobacteriaceae bacterium]
MKILKVLIVQLMLIFSFSLQSQNIKGRVVNQNNLSIAEASIYSQRMHQGTSTNNRGYFKLRLKSPLKNRDTIVISHINYITLKISFSDLKKRKFIIQLTSKTQSLDEVTVTTKREKLKTFLSYEKLPPMEKGLYGFGHAFINNILYIVGGDASDKFNPVRKDIVLDPIISRFNPNNGGYVENILSELGGEITWKRFNRNLYTYDIENKSWETSNKKFIKRAYHNVHHYNGKLLTIGGKRLATNRKFEYLENKIEEYSIKENRIAIDKTNPHKAVNFGSFLYKDKLVVLGGSNKQLKNGRKVFDNKVHVYDLKSGYWYHIGYMPVPKEMNGVLIDDTIYMFGGFNGMKLKNIESFNLKTGRWKIEGVLFKKEDKPSLTSYEHMIYIYVKSRILTFNTLTKELDQYLIDIDVIEPEIFYAKGKIYLLGGLVNQNDSRIEPSKDFYSIDIEEFDITRLNKTKTF